MMKHTKIEFNPKIVEISNIYLINHYNSRAEKCTQTNSSANYLHSVVFDVVVAGGTTQVGGVHVALSLIKAYHAGLV